MPDDVIEEEIAEQEPDPEGEAGFEEFAGDEPAADEIPAADEKPAEDKPADEKPVDKVDEDLPAKQAIDERIGKLDVKDDEPKPDDKPAATDEPAAAEQDKPVVIPASKPGDVEKGAPSASDQQPPAKTRLTKEQVAQHLGVISDDELPDGEVLIGNETIDFKAIKEDDPEVYNAMKVMSSIAGQKYLNAAVQSGKLVTADAFEKMRDDMGQVVARLEFSTQMSQRGHGDVLAIIDSKEYHEWIDKQSAGIKVLTKSDDMEDSVLIMDFYKESIGKAKASEHDDKATKAHKRKNDLLSGKKTTKPAGPGKKVADEDDDEASFNEHAG